MSDYWQMRDALCRRLYPLETAFTMPLRSFQPKGRKENYREFNLKLGGWITRRRELSEGRMKHFLELSTNVALCPMPLNLDVWDAPRCPFGCIYCFADRFRESLYSSFYDNVKAQLRYCSIDFLKDKLTKWFKNSNKLPEEAESPIGTLIAMRVPIRFGIRFENFLPREAKEGISLYVMRFLRERGHPLMINTKSPLVAQDVYLREAVDNKGGVAIHVTLLTVNEELAKRLEPGAPSPAKRLEAVKTMIDAGLTVVVRIGPFMPFITDGREDTEAFAKALKAAGVKDVTIDPFQNASVGFVTQANFMKVGLDGLSSSKLTSDTQFLSSLLLSRYMEELRAYGLRCSASTLPLTPSNEHRTCCAADRAFAGKAHYNRGCVFSAVRFILSQKGKSVVWEDFRKYVEEGGGFLSPSIERTVRHAWNLHPDAGGLSLYYSGLPVTSDTADGVAWLGGSGLRLSNFETMNWESLL